MKMDMSYVWHLVKLTFSGELEREHGQRFKIALEKRAFIIFSLLLLGNILMVWANDGLTPDYSMCEGPYDEECESKYYNVDLVKLLLPYVKVCTGIMIVVRVLMVIAYVKYPSIAKYYLYA